MPMAPNPIRETSRLPSSACFMAPANASLPRPGSTCRSGYREYPSALAWRDFRRKVLLAGRPGGEQLELVGGGRVRGCGIDVQLQAGFRWKRHRLEVEIELADGRVVQA